MRYEVNVTEEFERWWDALSIKQKEAITARVQMLEERGPALARPVVDQVSSSRHNHMKELRCSSDGALRVLFAFDPRQQAILLLGGDKTHDWNEWYVRNVPAADDLYDEYLDELRSEGLIE